jgi:hypothetical protein
MITFQEFIKSNANGYLYHTTTLDNVYQILGQNQLKGKAIWGTRVEEPAVYFSRSHRMSTWFGAHFREYKHPIILVFDRRKLSNNYRIDPIQNNPHRKDPTAYGAGNARTALRGVLAEEYILGDISNVDRYLVRIDVVYDNTWGMINREKSRYPKLKKHENLFHFSPVDFK